MPTYVVHAAPSLDTWSAPWSASCWATAPIAEVTHFLPESTNHHPRTQVRLLYDRLGLHGRFRVEDRWVRSVCAEINGPVHRDSCVEFFVQPNPGKGYFNIEFNAGGTLHASYITDPTRTPDGFRAFSYLAKSLIMGIRVVSTLPRRVEPERTEATEWELGFFLPFAVLEAHAGPVVAARDQVWKGNFYKCADDTSHPHWAAWSPVPVKNFHLPGSFGELRFA